MSNLLTSVSFAASAKFAPSLIPTKFPFTFEPATPDNPYAHTDQWMMGGVSFDGQSWATYYLGQRDDLLDRRDSNTHLTVLAGDGNDTIIGGYGADKLYGQNGHDSLNGGGGDDLILGGAGNDLINGGSGNDRLWGGAGSDTFAVDFGYTFTRHLPGGRGSYDVHVNNIDTIHDFATGDFIDLAVTGTADCYAEGQLVAGSGLDAARTFGQSLLDEGHLYAFVTDGTDGYLFVDRGDLDNGVSILRGLDSLNDFDWSNII